MSTKVIPFDFDQHPIRTVLLEDMPWFVASDVCGVLGIKNHRDSLRHLDDDEKGVVSTDTPGGIQQVSVVNESGLYALVLRSRKPEARKFAKWVTAEVLPAIRQTGSYGVPGVDFEYLREVRSKANNYLHECGKVIRELGGQEPKWPDMPEEAIAQGVIADIMSSARFLGHFDDKGRMHLLQIPPSSKLINPRNAEALREMITFGVPDDLVPELTRFCLDRLERMAKKGLKKH